jgi:hypothetical protein
VEVLEPVPLGRDKGQDFIEIGAANEEAVVQERTAMVRFGLVFPQTSRLHPGIFDNGKWFGTVRTSPPSLGFMIEEIRV